MRTLQINSFSVDGPFSKKCFKKKYKDNFNETEQIKFDKILMLEGVPKEVVKKSSIMKIILIGTLVGGISFCLLCIDMFLLLFIQLRRIRR